MTFTLDGDRLEAWLKDQQASLIQSAQERHADDGDDDPTALRMDGGAAFAGVLLNSLRSFEVAGRTKVSHETPRVPMEEITVEARDLVRTRARGTSWEAALSITPEKTQRMYKAIYRLLTALGPLTDHELRQAMEARNFAHSWSGLSARRVELERAGWVRDTGEKRVTQFGKKASVWEAVPEES